MFVEPQPLYRNPLLPIGWRPVSGSFWCDLLLMVKWQALWGYPQIQAADARVSPLATAAFCLAP